MLELVTASQVPNDMSGSSSAYRDRIYIIKDVILKLVDYGELNQTALISFCGLNLKKHKSILDDIEENGMIERNERAFGKRTVAFYRPTRKGMEFCKDILEPYEKVFPRRKDVKSSVPDNNTMTGLIMLLLI
jgi:predicted transcriptional regulator